MGASLKLLFPERFDWEERAFPDERPFVTLGRDSQAWWVLDSPSVQPIHCRIFQANGLWRIEDVGRFNQTWLNEGSLNGPTLLQSGDLVRLGSFALVFCDGVRAVEPVLEKEVAARPDDPRAWLVWADWLQEHGDPLGERIAQIEGGPKGGDDHWLEGLWRDASHGWLNVEWRHGLLRKAVVRASPIEEAGAWELRVTRLLALSAARQLEEVMLDVPGFLQERITERRTRDEVIERIAKARWPASLKKRSLGSVHLIDGVESKELIVASGAAVEVLAASGEHQFNHAVGDVVPIESGTLIRLFGRELFLGSMRTRDDFGVGRAHSFTLMNHRWTVGGLHNALLVNGHRATQHLLLPGDEIEWPGVVTLRFQVTGPS